MRWWNELKFIIRKLNRRRAAAELEAEIRTHLELETNERIEAGHSPEEAHYAARRVFGNVLIAKENSRAVWGFGLLELLWNDLRYGAKTLQKTPGFTLAAVLTLGLGIGVNTAVYSVINAIFFKPLQGTHKPEQLCRIKLLNQSGGGFEWVPYPDYLEIKQTSHTLTGLAAYVNENMEMGFKEQLHQTVRGEVVSGNYFQVLGVSAAIGRVLTPEDDTYGAGNALVLGHATWRNLFRSDPEIIGKEIMIGKQGFIIAGVAPANFHGAQPPTDAGYWITITKGSALNLMKMTDIKPDSRGFSLIGRLKPESNLRQLKTEMELVFSQFRQFRPKIYQNRFVGVESGGGFGLSSGDGKAMFILLGVATTVVGIILLIACANVAGLQLTRAMSRRREIAVRLALGASRGHVACLLLTESLLLAMLGGAIAIALSFNTTALLSQSLGMIVPTDPETVGLLLDFSPDWYVFIATSLISISVGIVCGLVPTLQASKADLIDVTKSEASLQTTRIRKLSWHNVLVVMQTAGSLVLLTAAGLFLRSVQRTMQVDPGFQTHNLLFTKIMVDRGRATPYQEYQLFRELQSRAALLPNVKSVSVGEAPLLERNGGRHVMITDSTEQKPFGDKKVESFFVTPKFLETAGIQVVAGRDFTEQDLQDSRRVVIINETIARRAFPGQNPIGRHLRLIPDFVSEQDDPVEIIGIAKDVKYHSLWDEPMPFIYRPIIRYTGYRGNYMVMFVRTYHDPAATLLPIAKLIRSIDPEASFTQSTMDQSIRNSLLPAKFASAFFAIFGAMGLILASIGLLGVMGYAVARRTKEIGVRMALGADRNNVLRMVIGDGLALTFTGIGIGLLAAAGLTRVLSGFLYGISHLDLLSYGGTILVLLMAALLACYFPARKASRVDPMTALRQD
jgi:macrolide transport system ATP-binding/permease protein